MKFYTKSILKGLLALILCATFTLQISAQDPGRAASTKIVDALNQLPADNQQLYNRLMDDIASTGEEGVTLLLTMLDKKDASLVPVQYALNGLAAYISAPGFDIEKRKVIAHAYSEAYNTLSKRLSGDPAKDAVENPGDLSNLDFLARQLNILKHPHHFFGPGPVIPPADVKVLAKELKAADNAAKKEPSQLNSAERCAALEKYILAAGLTTGEKTILKALSDPCREYRFAAIYAVDKLSPDAAWFDKVTAILPKLKKDAQIDVLYWLGENPSVKASSAVLPLLSSTDFETASQAAWTLTRMGTPENIQNIAQLLTSSDPAMVDLGEKCLASYPGDVCAQAVPLFANATPKGQVAILNLIAKRQDVEHDKIVAESLFSKDTEVVNAAYSALKGISREKDLKALYSLLENADSKYIASVQDAIMAAISQKSRVEQFNILTAQKNAAPADKQILYWPLVIKTADYLQVSAICTDLSGKCQNGVSTPLFDSAFQAYMKTISNKIPGAQRLLMLRNAMQFAVTDAQKVEILNAVAKTNTFLGIIFAGQFIEQPALQQAAAQAVRLIATGNADFNSPEVTALLKRAAQVITGPDSGYEITAINQHLEKLPKDDMGFVSIFNGKDLTGWKGLLKGPNDNPFKRATLKPKELAKAQKEADELMAKTWIVEDGNIVFTGHGQSLCTEKQYGDFEMYIDWLLYPEGPEADAGIYLRGTPQVQIWDTARVNVGAQVGSGGLYNNKRNPSKPLCVADNGLGQWNSFYIKMVGERVTVFLNGVLVVDNVVLENYWDRSKPIFPMEQIELQAHGSKVAYRDIYIRELPQVTPYTLSEQEQKEGFDLLFDGISLHRWQGNKIDYTTENGTIAVKPTGQGFGNLYTDKEYGDFIFRFEFKLTPGANNGIGIRTPLTGDAAYVGMEIQVLDHFDAIYQPGLRDYQYHGSVYGIIPAQRQDALKPVGEWNVEEIYAKGDYIRVTLNGVVITEGNIREATKNGTYDHNEHPGLFNPKGYIGFLGHGSQLWFRNVRIKEIK